MKKYLKEPKAHMGMILIWKQKRAGSTSMGKNYNIINMLFLQTAQVVQARQTM